MQPLRQATIVNQQSWRFRRLVGVALACSALNGALPLSAQTVTNPRILNFAPSSDHNAILSDGSAKVSRYDLRFYYQGATQPFQTNSLGKAAPGADGLIHLNLARTVTAWPLNVGTTFEASVSAVGPGGTAESARSNPFTFSSPLAVTSLTSNVAFPAPAGTVVTWTATSGGGTGPHTYKFWLYDGATWAVGRDWGASNTWTWIPSRPGTYLVQVWARNAASGTADDAWRQAAGSIGNPRPLTVTVDKPDPIGAAAGQPVTWTARTSGGSGPFTYQFWVFDGARWRAAADWSTSNQWVWTPPSPGTYSFQVWVRNAGSSARLDAFQSFGPYTAVRPAAPAATSLIADYASPMPAGTPITWTATASGGTGPYTYQFWISNGSTSTIGRAWSTTPTWTWIPSTPGTYSVQVWIRTAGSAAQYDARRDADPYTIENPTALVVTGVVSDRTFPVPQDTPVTWTASALGGTGPYTYKFYVHDGVGWSIGRDWSTSRTWTWLPARPSTYSFQVWVRNAGSGANYDAYRSAGPVTIGGSGPLQVAAITMSPMVPLVTGAPAVLTATATGGSGPYMYEFWVFNGSTWSLGKSWSASNTFSWTPAAPGAYTIQVWIRNAGSTGPDAWLNFTPIGVIP